MADVNNLNWQIMFQKKQRLRPINDLDSMIVNLCKEKFRNKDEDAAKMIFLPVFGLYANLETNQVVDEKGFPVYQMAK